MGHRAALDLHVTFPSQMKRDRDGGRQEEARRGREVQGHRQIKRRVRAEQHQVLG